MLTSLDLHFVMFYLFDNLLPTAKIGLFVMNIHFKKFKACKIILQQKPLMNFESIKKALFQSAF